MYRYLIVIAATVFLGGCGTYSSNAFGSDSAAWFDVSEISHAESRRVYLERLNVEKAVYRPEKGDL